MDAIVEAVAVFPSESTWFHPRFKGGSCCSILGFLCNIYSFEWSMHCMFFLELLLITPSVSSTLSFDGCLGESLLWGRHIETVEVFSASNNIPINWFVSFTTRYGWFTYNKPYVRYTNVLMYKLIFSIIPKTNNPCLENRIYYYQRLKKTNVFIVKIYLYVITLKQNISSWRL